MSKVLKRRTLFDVDGPLTEGFVEVVCALLREYGIDAKPELVDNWDPMVTFNTPDDIRKLVSARLAGPGIAREFPLRNGAMDFLAWAREHSAVYAVTSPWDSPHWMSERTAWLRDRLAFHPNHIAHIHDKLIVYGDVLVDDKHANVVEWQEAHPNGLAVFWRMSYNQGQKWHVNVSNFEELRALLSARWGV